MGIMTQQWPWTVLLLAVSSTVITSASSGREPHVINVFNPSPALSSGPGGLSSLQPASAARPQLVVDAAPSEQLDDGGEGADDVALLDGNAPSSSSSSSSSSAAAAATVPGYGLNGGHGDVTPWLPSAPTWALQQQQTAVEKHMRVITAPTPHYILNRPPAGDRIDAHPEVENNAKPPSRPPQQQQAAAAGAAGAAVSETDMYLLGAIEKLVYRVDFLEKRLRRTEELVYYLMEGAGNKQDAAEPCPKDFTRAGRHCYHFAGRNLNWKSASSACKAMDSILVEMNTPEDKRDLVNWILAHQEFRGRDFWTGGLNPGLLWIWANSARPVVTPSPSSSGGGSNGSSANAIKNPGGGDIPGSGRCLVLAHSPATRQYQYQGGDCGARHRFVCQLEEPSSSRALSRIHKSLNISLDGAPPPPPLPSSSSSH